VKSSSSARAPIAMKDRLVGELARTVPTLPYDAPLSEIAETCLADEAHDWLVLVDEDGDAVRLIERAAFLRGEPFEHHAALLPATMTIRACARRAIERPRAQRLRPLLCKRLDDRRWGIVGVEHLLEALIEGPRDQALTRPAAVPAALMANSPSVKPGS
jgi:hypothetical protein